MYFRSSHHLSTSLEAVSTRQDVHARVVLLNRSQGETTVNSMRSKGSKFVTRGYPIQLASRLIMYPSEQRYNHAHKS